MLPNLEIIECITKLMVSIVALRNVIINRCISSLVIDIHYNILWVERIYVVFRFFMEYNIEFYAFHIFVVLIH
jgi:hypothetical protein